MPNIGAANISKIRLAQQGGDPAVPAAGFWYLYIRSDGLYVEDESGAVTGPLVEATETPAANAVPQAGAGGELDKGWYPNFVASGASHAKGAVPDPGAGGGTTKYLREDATWQVPAGAGDVVGPAGATADHLAVFNGGTGKLIKDGGAALTNPMDSAGDLIVGGVAGAPAKLDSGTSGYQLVAKGAASPAWEAQYSTINFVIDGGGSEIADGVAGDLVVDFACTIVSWTLLADVSGAIKIDVWVEHYADYPPTDADTICNAHEPEIPASGVKAQDTDLSDWITNPPAIAAGQTIRFNVDSCTDITRCTLALKVQRT